MYCKTKVFYKSMIYLILDVAYCILTYMPSSHYIKQRNMILSKKNPRKRKLTTMIHLGMRPKKIRKGTLTFHRTVVLPLLATISGSTDREWDRKEWETAVECILIYASSSHYIKHGNMILSYEIQENENGQQWCIQVWDQKRKEKALTFHRQLFCHCLQLL